MDEKEKERLSKLYFDSAITLVCKILELQAGDITEEELFAFVKATVNPKTYEPLYHKIVLKDFLGATFGLDAEDMETDAENLNDVDDIVLKE